MSSTFAARFRARYAVLRFLPGIALEMSAGILSSVAVAANAPLTLAGAQRLATQRSRQLAAKDYSTAVSREMTIAAGQLSEPVLKACIDNLLVHGADRFSTTRNFMAMCRIGVMQEFTRIDERRSRAARFEREAEKSAAEKVASIAAIQRDTALAWLDRYYAEAMAAVIAEQATQTKFEIQTAEGAYRAGLGNQADIFAAHSTLVAVDDRVSEAERQETFRMPVAQTRAMSFEWENGRGCHARSGRELIPLANQRTAATHPAYRDGKASLKEVLDARRNEIDMRMQALQLETDTAQLRAQLNFLFTQDGDTAYAPATMYRDSQ